MNNIFTISSREFSRISAREIILARWRREFPVHNYTIDPESTGLSDTIREAVTVQDSGRQFELAGSTTSGIRTALAQNIHLHPDVQMLLLKDSEEKVKVMLSTNKNLTEAAQKALSRGRIDVRLNLAKNQTLKESVQIRMCSHPKESDEVIDELIRNPSLTWSAASVLLPKLTNWKASKLFGENTTLDFQKNIYEKFIAEGEHNSLALFLSSAKLVDEMKTRILGDMNEGNIQTYKSLSSNHFAGDAIRDKVLTLIAPLEERQKKEAETNLARTVETPELINKMIGLGFSKLVSENNQLTQEMMMSILSNNTNDKEIFANIAEVLHSQSQPNTVVNSRIVDLMMAYANFESIVKISSHISVADQSKIIAHVEKLIADKKVHDYDKSSFIKAISQNKEQSPAVQMLTAKYGDVYAKAGLATTSPSEEIQNAIFDSSTKIDGYYLKQIIRGLTNNENLSPSVRYKIITETQVNSLEAALKLSNLTEDELDIIISRATESSIDTVLSDIAKMPALSQKLQSKIISSGFSQPIHNLAMNNNLSPALQTAIVDETKEYSDSDISKSMAKRIDLLPETIKMLAKSSWQSTKEMLLRNDTVPEDIKKYLREIIQTIEEARWNEDRYYSEGSGGVQPTKEKQIEFLESGDPLLFRLVARHSAEPEILETFIDKLSENSIGITIGLSKNKNIPITVQKALFNLNHREIENNLFKNIGVDMDLKISVLEKYNNNPMQKQELLNILFDQGIAPRAVQLQAYEATKGKEIREGTRTTLNRDFARLVRLQNLDPQIQMEIAKNKKAHVRLELSENRNLDEAVQKRLALDKSKGVRFNISTLENLSEAVQKILIKDPDSNIRREVVRGRNLSSDIQQEIVSSDDLYMQAFLAKNPSATPEVLKILASNESPSVRESVAESSKIDVDTQKALAKDPHVAVRASIAENPIIDKDIQMMLVSDNEYSVTSALKRNQNLHPEIKIRVQSKPPEGFNKDEFIARVHKNKYVFRILEKYMEDNNMTQLASQDFKGKPIERYRQQPLVDAMFKENNGKPLTLEHIKKAIKKMDAKEFYIYHGDFSSGIQSHEKFNRIPRHSFALLFKDLDADSETQEFMKDIAPQMAHGHHSSMGGWGAMNMGWILWKNISKVMGHPAILIEQVQSDWRGLTAKIKAIKDDINDPSNHTAGQILAQWDEKHGQESLGRIQKNLDELVKDYPEKLMAEFLSNSGVRGKTVYITDKETQRGLVGHEDKKSTMLDVIYDRVPAIFGFQPSTELPGFLKLERANTRYRHIIRQAAIKIINNQ